MCTFQVLVEPRIWLQRWHSDLVAVYESWNAAPSSTHDKCDIHWVIEITYIPYREQVKACTVENKKLQDLQPSHFCTSLLLIFPFERNPCQINKITFLNAMCVTCVTCFSYSQCIGFFSIFKSETYLSIETFVKLLLFSFIYSRLHSSIDCSAHNPVKWNDWLKSHAFFRE